MTNLKYTKEIIENAVSESTSWPGVCRILGLSERGGSQSHIKKRAQDYDIDFSHFPGPGWSRGKILGEKYPLEDYLNNVRSIGSHKLKEKLLKVGLKERRCEECLRTKWEGQEIPIELDHINGHHEDNRLENLQILCPNCHAVKTANSHAEVA